MTKFSHETDDGDSCLPFIFDLNSTVKFVTRDNVADVKILFADAYILGIDTETRPSFYNRKTRFGRFPTSLIQIAVRTKTEYEYVIIIDLLSLSNNEDSLIVLNDTLLKVMSDSDIVKIGQGLENDLRELCLYYPTLSAFKYVPSIIDTNILLRYLHPEIKQDVSLKNLTRSFLHCNLVKTQQLSDWAIRPLKNCQIDYAAKDALVLLRLFDAMTCEAIEKGNDFNLTLLLKRYENGVHISKKSIIKLTSIKADTELNVANSFPTVEMIEKNRIIIHSMHTRFEESSSSISIKTEDESQLPLSYYDDFLNNEEMTDANYIINENKDDNSDENNHENMHNSNNSNNIQDVVNKYNSNESLDTLVSSDSNDSSNSYNQVKKRRKVNKKAILQPLHTLLDKKS